MNLERLTGRDLAPLEALIDADYPERLREMATCLFATLIEDPLSSALPRPALARLALDLTDQLSTELGGANFYMHKGHHYRLSLRDRQMMREYRGNNIPQLAAKYRLTETRVRQIVAAYEAEEFARRQPSLPGLSENGL